MVSNVSKVEEGIERIEGIDRIEGIERIESGRGYQKYRKW
jgi:hypothetical protein